MKNLVGVLAVMALVAAMPAEARFGKRSGGSSSSSSHSSSSSSSSYHGATSVGSPGSHSTGYTAGSYSRGYSFNGRSRFWGGYYGGYVPLYGYGYGSTYRTVVTPVQSVDGVPADPDPIRLSASVEAMAFIQSQSGFALGAAVGFESGRWGFNVSAQNISARADDGSLVMDQIQQLNAHLTFAALTGQYGRLRFEAGADTFWAADLTVITPTIGMSGFVLVAGPVALEGSVMVTPYPIRQLDARAGLAVGFGPVGIRAGFRTQMLDDQGLVDGIVNQDVFMGPCLGLGLAI